PRSRLLRHLEGQPRAAARGGRLLDDLDGDQALIGAPAAPSHEPAATGAPVSDFPATTHLSPARNPVSWYRRVFSGSRSRPGREGPTMLKLVLTILIPYLLLTRLGDMTSLEPRVVLLVALAFPMTYMLVATSRRRDVGI